MNHLHRLVATQQLHSIHLRRCENPHLHVGVVAEVLDDYVVSLGARQALRCYQRAPWTLFLLALAALEALAEATPGLNVSCKVMRRKKCGAMAGI